MFDDFNSTTWVALAFGGFGIFVAAFSWLSMPEFRQFWNECMAWADRKRQDDADGSRCGDRIAALGEMSDGWQPQNEVHPYARDRMSDDLAALAASDRVKRNARRAAK